MAKRSAMGRDPLGWIGASERESTQRADPASTEAAPQAVEGPPEVGGSPEPEPSEGPKFLHYEVLTARLRGDQVDLLNQLERRIMRSRRQRGERITKNSLLRAAVDLLGQLEVDLAEIRSEDELRDRVLGSASGGSVSKQ